MREGRRASDVPRFGRRFFEGGESLSAIGGGALGGKASGLVEAQEALAARPAGLRFPDLHIDVPTAAIVATDAFDAFLDRNRMRDVIASGADDRELAAAFVRAELPAELVGDLWEVVRQARQPLAVRSSSLLEDALAHPLAGIYLTKMTPNNQHDPESRFRRLTEAIKLVYASAFFRDARAYRASIGGDARSEEKMAVVIQEVVGRRHGPRFYPDVSAVARSLSFYPIGQAEPEDGVMDLALGLGKTIVEGERCWTACPRWPRAVPPFASVRAVLQETQTRFWAVNMGPPPPYDPVNETEYLTLASLAEAEQDGTLALAASTYDPGSDRLRPGTAAVGPRVIDFAPVRELEALPLPRAIVGLLELFQERLSGPVEIELALTSGAESARLGFLQVRPMPGAGDSAALTDQDLAAPGVVVASGRALGNGVVEGIRDVVYLEREGFDLRHSRAMAEQVAEANGRLAADGRPYLLVGFGRWGSADPWLGIPVTWGQISAARVLVEAALPGRHVDPSQGAHFFHNLLGLRIPYLSVPEDGRSRVDWDWLESLPRVAEWPFVRHVRTPGALLTQVHGRGRRGRVMRVEAGRG